MTALASAALASPAAAVEAPVIVPLQGLEPILPMGAPTVESGVPVPIPGAPTGFHQGHGPMPDIALPSMPLTGTLPKTVVDAPLPELLTGSRTGRTLLSTPQSDMKAATPGAVVGNPVKDPRGNGLASLPELVAPQIGLLGPVLSGDLDGQLGLVPAAN